MVELWSPAAKEALTFCLFIALEQCFSGRSIFTNQTFGLIVFQKLYIFKYSNIHKQWMWI